MRIIAAGRAAAAIAALLVSVAAAGADAQPAAMSPHAGFDGSYVGTMTLAQDNAAGQRGVFHGKLSACSAGPFNKTLTVRGGQFSFPYNAVQHLTIAGTVAADGTVSGSTTSTTGYVVLTAKIAGGQISGTVGGNYCTYSLQLRRL